MLYRNSSAEPSTFFAFYALPNGRCYFHSFFRLVKLVKSGRSDPTALEIRGSKS